MGRARAELLIDHAALAKMRKAAYLVPALLGPVGMPAMVQGVIELRFNWESVQIN